MGTIMDAQKKLTDAREQIKDFVKGFIRNKKFLVPGNAHIDIEALTEAVDKGGLDALINV